MAAVREDLPEEPEEIDALRAALLAERARAARVEAELAVARAKASDDAAVIAHQRLQIEKLTRQLYGPRSERTVRLLDQMELAFEELESSASEDEIAAERAVAKTTNVVSFTRRRPARQPFPEHLPRERVVEPGPTACLCCGSPRLRKLGEDVTETLEVIPRRWKVIQHVREKVYLPRLREDQPGAGALSREPPLPGRAEPAGDDPVREVRAASAVEPPGRTLCKGGSAAQPVDLGRPGGRVRCRAGTAAAARGGARLRRRTSAR